MTHLTSTEQRLQGRADSERYVVFLDIDGVLQPCSSQKRFDHDLEQTRVDMAEQMKDDRYLELDKYDVAAVYYDWNEAAVNNLRKLLDRCDAEVVISSDWKRTRSIEEMKLLFHIHGLDQYITEMTPYTDYSFKPDEIREYLEQHPGLGSYVILDDLDMEKHFRGHMVYTGMESFLTTESMLKARRILEYGPWWEERYERKTSPQFISNGELITDHYKKVLFLNMERALECTDSEQGGSGDIDYRFVRNLYRIVNKTGAEIVLSASWRERFVRYAKEGFPEEDADMQALLKNLDMYKVKIPGITSGCMKGPDGRPSEIKCWLCHRPEVEDFVILDDGTVCNWNWLKPHVICTKEERGLGRSRLGYFHHRGLDDEYTERVIDLLGDKRRK